MRNKGLQIAICLAAVASVGAVVSGCGAGTGGELGGEPPDFAKALAGAPAPLAALYKQDNRLLPGGTEAYERRLAGLRGYPVVVNVWASWCGPCRFEFPTLQELSADYGKRVAFLGVNSEDSEDAAKTFLREEPVPYPSYSDPGKEITRAIGSGKWKPATAFYDRAGELCYLKLGPYTEHAELTADVRRFAVREECESG